VDRVYEDVIKKFYLWDHTNDVLLKTMAADQREISIDDVAIGTCLSIKCDIGYVVAQDAKLWIYNAPEASFATRNVPPPRPEELEWYGGLTQAEKNRINADDILADWLKVTARYDTNLNNLYVYNQGVGEFNPWRKDARILFHGDEQGRTPEEIFATGLVPSQPRKGTMNFITDSAFVSALECMTYSLLVGYEFADIYSYENPLGEGFGYIYLTNAPRGIYLGRNLYEAEVDFAGGVRCEYVFGCFKFKYVTNAAPDPVYYFSNKNSHYYNEDKGFFGSAPEGMVDILFTTDERYKDVTFYFTKTSAPARQLIINEQVVRLPARGKFSVEARFRGCDEPIDAVKWSLNFGAADDSHPSFIGHDGNAVVIDLERDPIAIINEDGASHKILIINIFPDKP
jgi:hypothetical protein